MAAIAPWFCLRLPSCGPGFESQALHLCFFQFVIDLWCEKDENKQNIFFKKLYYQILLFEFSIDKAKFCF